MYAFRKKKYGSTVGEDDEEKSLMTIDSFADDEDSRAPYHHSKRAKELQTTSGRLDLCRMVTLSFGVIIFVGVAVVIIIMRSDSLAQMMADIARYFK